MDKKIACKIMQHEMITFLDFPHYETRQTKIRID
jgi:hypothetical protein